QPPLRLLRGPGGHDRPRAPSVARRPARVDERRRSLLALQPPQGGPPAVGDRVAPPRDPVQPARLGRAPRRARAAPPDLEPVLGGMIGGTGHGWRGARCRTNRWSSSGW